MPATSTCPGHHHPVAGHRLALRFCYGRAARALALWTSEVFVSDEADVPFQRFVGALSDFTFVALRAAIDRVLLIRGIDLARTEWLKPLGGGLHEVRVRHDADEIAHMFGHDPEARTKPATRIVLRLFVHFYGSDARPPRTTKATGSFDLQWPSPRNGCTGGGPLKRDYDSIVTDRAARVAPHAAARREVFERAYDIAVQVIALRERHGLTQQQLAERCGIDQGDISRIERGSTSPTARTLQRIADALDADLRLVARAS